ncbi:MAG: hypothetical protein MZV49_04330 [Rhodopseudomonas palustris]|nr:hypothetical protein [Rhodopseudomonas palustris]
MNMQPCSPSTAMPISADQVFARFLGRSAQDTRAEVEAELGRSIAGVISRSSERPAQRRVRCRSCKPSCIFSAALDAIAAAGLRGVVRLA